ncbi:MAG TPA: hypothetical protein VF544_07585 [Pyrinomonadaceae bacterium]|jgi:hypothetical protein
MSISRRKFLQVGSVVAVAAGFPLKAAVTAIGQGAAAPAAPSGAAEGVAGGTAPTAATGKATSARPALLLSKATFAPYLNTAFVVQSKRTRAVEVKLVEVSSRGPVPDQQVPGKECFALVFSGQQRLSQDVYEFKHAALGTFNLLLVPVGMTKRGKGQYYEAVINRLN